MDSTIEYFNVLRIAGIHTKTVISMVAIVTPINIFNGN